MLKSAGHSNGYDSPTPLDVSRGSRRQGSKGSANKEPASQGVADVVKNAVPGDLSTSPRASPRVGGRDRVGRSRTKRLSVAEASGARGCCVLNPDSSQVLRVWDIFNGVALMFVCFVTPYEVAFLTLISFDALFFINRVLDLFFVTDMILQFFIMPEVKHRYGVIYIVDQRLIVKRYLHSWFLIDFMSLMPFDVLGLAYSWGDVSRLKLVRTIRLLRLLKLARLFRGLRVIQRWEVRIGFPYRSLTLVRLMAGVVIVVHWTSCILGLLSMFQGDACFGLNDESPDCVITWITLAFDERFGPNAQPGDKLSPLSQYVVALHTATTIVIHPHASTPTSSVENLVFLILLCFGGWVWTQVLSRSASISMSLDRHHISHHQTMDDLNVISKDMNLSDGLRRRLRRFFLSSVDSSQRSTWQGLCDRMSPQLQSEVARELNRAWIYRVPFLAACPGGLITDVCGRLGNSTFAQGEHFGVPLNLYILNRGMAAKDQQLAAAVNQPVDRLGRRPSMDSVGLQSYASACIRMRRPGAVWGEEHLLLSVWWLLDPNASLAFTFVEVVNLSRPQFEKIVEDHPGSRKLLRRHVVKCALRMGILHEARRRVAAEHADYAPEETSLEQFTRSNARHDTETDETLHRVHMAQKVAQQRLNERRPSFLANDAHEIQRSPSKDSIFRLDSKPEVDGHFVRKLETMVRDVDKHVDRRLQAHARSVGGQMTEQSMRLDLVASQVGQILEMQKNLLASARPSAVPSKGANSRAQPQHNGLQLLPPPHKSKGALDLVMCAGPERLRSCSGPDAASLPSCSPSFQREESKEERARRRRKSFQGSDVGDCDEAVLPRPTWTSDNGLPSAAASLACSNDFGCSSLAPNGDGFHEYDPMGDKAPGKPEYSSFLQDREPLSPLSLSTVGPSIDDVAEAAVDLQLKREIQIRRARALAERAPPLQVEGASAP